MNGRAVWISAALLVVALGVGLASSGPSAQSVTPSVDNKGPRGAAVLWTWLSLRQTVSRTSAPFSELPADVKTVVIIAPSAAEVAEAEVGTLREFVKNGGTLVYLAPRGFAQPALHRWLDLTVGPLAPLVDDPALHDAAGTSAKVTFNGSLTSRVHTLRLAADRQVTSSLEAALPVAEFEALWFIKEGAGEIWVGSGGDLAENSRLEALDNAQFWAAVADRGPVLFDEYHHLASAAVKTPRSVWATGLQFGLCALIFVLVFGARLGPPRQEPARIHRSGVEYVQAMAEVTRRAHVEPELLASVQAQTRMLAHERLGIPVSLSWADAAVEVKARLASAAEAFAKVGASVDFVQASTAAAQFERTLLGLS